MTKEITVFVLTRYGEHDILAVFSTRELAENARNSCFVPDEITITPMTLDDWILE